MAATTLRDTYDCVVLGSSRTAAQVAAAVARTGRQTLHLSPAQPPPAGWLHPRWSSQDRLEISARSPLSGVTAWNCAGKITAVIKSANSPSAARLGTPTTATSFQLPAGCHIAQESPREVRLNGALPPLAIQAPVVMRIESTSSSADFLAIGGAYRGVSSPAGEDRQAALFATRRASELFWLVPQADGLWSLGLRRTGLAGDLAGESMAGTFEDALVACPALTQRLIAAELVGELHLATAAPLRANQTAGAVSLPAYDDWFDPVFASADWLGEELAGQLTAALSSVPDFMENTTALAEWQHSWQAVEQLTRERLAPWYERNEELPAALQDHAQRAWYEKLLAGERLTGPSAHL